MYRKTWEKLIWTEDMLTFLKMNYQTMTNKEMAEALGLRLTSTRTKLYELGFKRMEMEYWTAEQIKYLQDYYKTMGDVELAEIFNKNWHKEKGWTKKHIEKKRRYLKLKRTEEQKFKILLRNIDQGRMDNCHWANAKLRFQLPIGSIITRTIGGYKTKLIKIKGGFKKLALVNYEKHIGHIPSGLLVIMKDGNPLNCNPKNLTLITREEQSSKMHMADRSIAFMLSMKKEQGTRGSIRKDEKLFNEILKHPEIIELKRAQYLLKRSIKNVA
jgi:hypothetical protein